MCDYDNYKFYTLESEVYRLNRELYSLKQNNENYYDVNKKLPDSNRLVVTIYTYEGNNYFSRGKFDAGHGWRLDTYSFDKVLYWRELTVFEKDVIEKK